MARRRSSSWNFSPGLIVVGVLLLALIGLVVNGIIFSARSSSSYETLNNTSFALQANDVIATQNVQGEQLSALLANAPGMSRQTLAQELTALVRATASSAGQAQIAASSAPSGNAGSEFSTLVSQRAQGTGLIEQVISGLLGLGAIPGTSASSALLTTSQATSELEHANTLILEAQRLVPSVRQTLINAPGHAVLHPSIFISDPSLLTSSSMVLFVSSLESSPTLAVKQQLVLSSVSLSPTPLPVTGAQGSITLPPATNLVVTVVVTNAGNVGENPVAASVALTSIQGGSAQRVHATSSVAVGGAVSITMPSLRVQPGTTVSLLISLNPAPGQQDRSGLTQSYTMIVAPASTTTTGG